MKIASVNHLFTKNHQLIKDGLILFLLIMLFGSLKSQDIHAQISDIIFKNTLVRMTWQEVKTAAENKAIVLVPISVVEEHGPHMDLSPDITETSDLCSTIKEILENDNISAVIAPPFYWGINNASGAFEGSFSLTESTMKLVLSEIIANMNKWGFENFYFLNVHGDSYHKSAISNIAKSLNSINGQHVYDVNSLRNSSNPPIIPPRNAGAYSPDYHAGAGETKTIWAIEPSIIRTDVVSTLKPQNSFSQPLGYVGDPANYLTDNGDEIWKAYGKNMADRIKYQILTASTSNSVGSIIPINFSLSQNYPNPYNPTTTIDYQIPSLSKVKLVVYDSLGQEIVKLVDEIQGSGNYKVNFDGSSLPSGAYFYKLQAGNHFESRKMMLIK